MQQASYEILTQTFPGHVNLCDVRGLRYFLRLSAKRLQHERSDDQRPSIHLSVRLSV